MNRFDLLIDKTDPEAIPYLQQITEKFRRATGVYEDVQFNMSEVAANLIDNEISSIHRRMNIEARPHFYCIVVLLTSDTFEEALLSELRNLTSHVRNCHVYFLLNRLREDLHQGLQGVIGVDVVKINFEENKDTTEAVNSILSNLSDAIADPIAFRIHWQNRSHSADALANIKPPLAPLPPEPREDYAFQDDTYSNAPKQHVAPPDVLETDDTFEEDANFAGTAAPPPPTPEPPRTTSYEDPYENYRPPQKTRMTSREITPREPSPPNNTVAPIEPPYGDLTQQTGPNEADQNQAHRPAATQRSAARRDRSFEPPTGLRTTSGPSSPEEPPPTYQSAPYTPSPRQQAAITTQGSRGGGSIPPSVDLKPSIREVLYGYIPAPQGSRYDYPEDEFASAAGLDIGARNRWAIAGASRRGLSHWNKGVHRDDAFDFVVEGGWHILAVSDGAGSAKMSRVTAHGSTALAVDVIRRYAHPMPATPEEAQNRMKKAMLDAIQQVHAFQTNFTQENGLDKRDTYCTLLLLIHQPFPNRGCVFATFQVGDGYLQGVSHKLSSRIAQGDHGQDVGTSQFVLSFTASELAQRVIAHYSENQIHTFVLVTDGIEDDLKPSSTEHARNITLDTNMGTFTQRLLDSYLAWPHWPQWGELLLDAISYERQGSYDDRTLLVLTLLPENSMPYHEV